MSKSMEETKKEFSLLYFFLFSFLEKSFLEYGWSSMKGEFYILMNERFQQWKHVV